ncbi:site-specific integrase [Spirillospora sp. NPDC052242]
MRWEDIRLVGCRACGGDEGAGDSCGRCAGSGIESGTLEIVQTLQRVGGALRFVPPKTDDSTRTVPLLDLCISALREHRARQDAERADGWATWKDHGLVFPSRLGTPMEPDNLRRSWYRIREAAGLDSMRFHDMRHTCVSLLLDLGVPPHIVREIVGHSDIEVTMTIYAHAALEEKRAALRKLGMRSADAAAVATAVKRHGRIRFRAFWLVIWCGQGRGRTADLPLFRSHRLSAVLTCENPGRSRARSR